MQAYWRLPESLQSSAYCADGEYAWARDEALKVIEFLSERDYAVIGVDVWLATEPGPTVPTPGVYTWEAGLRRASELPASFARRVNHDAARYVKYFVWHCNDGKNTSSVPYFNLTLLEDDDASS